MMPQIVKMTYVLALRTKFAELRASKKTNAQIIAELNAPVLLEEGDERADPPVPPTYGPSWARGIGLGELLPEFVEQVDGYAGMTDEAIREELATLLIDAVVVPGLRAEERTAEDAAAEVSREGER